MAKTKRYSLAVGPPKRDPKVKGVQSAAVQAFLKRKEEELRKKALEEKRKKEELVKKRIELKHDKKARAMAKRTKDNFYGYDGIPLEEKAKKKHGIEGPTGQEADQECSNEEDTEPPLEYCQTESENEEFEEYEEQEAPLKTIPKPKAPLRSAPPPMNFTDLLRLAEKKQYEPVEIKVVKKIEERPRTAEELREKEFLERKHKNIDRGKEKKMLEREKRLVPPTMSKKVPSSKESVSERHRGPGDKHSSSRGSHLPHIGAEKKSRSSATTEKTMRLPSSKSQPGERTKASSGDTFQHSPSESHSLLLNGSGKSRSSSHSMGTGISKTMVHGTQKSNEHRPSKSPSSHPSHSKSGVVSTPHEKTRNSGAKHPGNNSNSTSGRPGVGTARPVQSPSPRKHGGSSSSGPEQQTSGSKRLVGGSGPSGRLVSGSSGRGHPTSNLGSSGRPLSGTSSTGRTVTPVGRPVSGLNGPGRPSSGGPGRPISNAGGPGRPSSNSGGSGRLSSNSGGPGRPTSGSGGPGRPTSSSGGPGQTVSGSGGPGRTVSGSGGPGRTASSSGGPGRTVGGSGPSVKPRCTVVSETISSKNIISRPSNGMVNGMRPPPPGYRPAVYPQGAQRPPFPPMARKRYLEEDEDEEYDSEMEDFIDDEGEPQEEISKHIREIFGYDRNKYKDESDYALRYMESSWKEQQKEEAKSLRLGMQEDLEEMRREEEELKRRKAKKMKLR
ncbi:protein SPT2 homolog isoform X2 [Monodelphis domestica]|uniref:protein SPT2 homolog isoform X2 n=1 Tax=Monodelphis domestica TaxID=13616 RepID=UPI0004436574|nr:protein SPT2 homolog isoform X2 [Monodelphis domestica]